MDRWALRSKGLALAFRFGDDGKAVVEGLSLFFRFYISTLAALYDSLGLSGALC